MKISACNNLNTQNVSFRGENSLYDQATQLQKEAKDTIKNKKGVEVATKLEEQAKALAKQAEKEVKSSNAVKKMVTLAIKYLGRGKTGNKVADTASQLTKIVLMGNVGKEAVGTALYTVQALTNEDLPKDKRKFVGMYDLAVGVVSTIFSFIFGVGLEKTIKNQYKNLLKPLSENEAMRTKTGIVIAGLAAFSSFALQTIIGKRIIAPAIATPAAGKLKKYMEKKEAEKNGTSVTQDSKPLPLTKDGFIDLGAKPDENNKTGKQLNVVSK